MGSGVYTSLPAPPPAPADMYFERVVPVDGETVIMGGPGSTGLSNANGMMVVEPAEPLAALTILLPADASTEVLQERNIAFSQAVAALTIGQVGGGLTILNLPPSVARNDSLPLQKFGSNDWRVIFKS